MLIAASLFIQDAYPCSPAPAEIIDIQPYTHPLSDAPALLYPLNSIFKVEYGNGYILENPALIMTVDSDEVPTTIQGYTQTLDLIKQHSVYEIRPTVPLEEDRLYKLYALEGTQLTLLSSFRSSSAEAEIPPAPNPPSLEMEYQNNQIQSSCDSSATTSFSFSFDSGPENTSLNLYSVDANRFTHNETITENDVGQRFYTFLHASSIGEVTIVIEDDREWKDYCFVARYSNEGGREGPLSSVFCTYIPDGQIKEESVGCSTISHSSLSLSIFAFALYGYTRRKKYTILL